MTKKILLIESDPALAGSIAGALHARGAEVAHVRDAASAVDVARGARPDGIVLCAELPGGSGFVVCNKIRKDPDLKEIPLLLTSANATDETFEQHRKLKTRADGYLRKPFAIAALMAQLEQLAGLAEPAPGAPDDEDLAAFDAAFDSIAQVDESGPIDHPISSEDVDAAAALVADLPEAEEQPPFAPPVADVDGDAELLREDAAPLRAELTATMAELARARADLAATAAELAHARAELAEANAAREELSARLDAASRELDGAAAQAGDAIARERERVRAVLAAAIEALGAGPAPKST